MVQTFKGINLETFINSYWECKLVQLFQKGGNFTPRHIEKEKGLCKCAKKNEQSSSLGNGPDRRQPKGSSVLEWIHQLLYNHTLQYYANKKWPTATQMLSKGVRHRGICSVWFLLYEGWNQAKLISVWSLERREGVASRRGHKGLGGQG